MSCSQLSSMAVFTALFKSLFHSFLDGGLSNNWKMDGKLYNFKTLLTNINQLLSFSSFITNCLRAISFSIEPFCLIMFTKVVRAFLCKTACKGKTPKSARHMVFGVLSGRPWIYFRHLLWNLSRHSMSFFLSSNASRP